MAENDMNEVDSEALLLQMFNEIKSNRARIKKRFESLKTPTSFEECKQQTQLLAREIDGTVLSYLQDTAHYLGQHVIQMEAIWDRMESGSNSEETQFTLEDAPRFEKVLTYAKQNIEGILNHPDVPTTPEQKALLVGILEDANYCLASVSENTLEEDNEDDEEDDENEGEETETPPDVQ